MINKQTLNTVFAPEAQTFDEAIEECKRDPPVTIGPSKRHGQGVFATRDIPKGHPVCYYDGDDISDSNGISIDDHIYSVNWPSSWLPEGSSARTRIGYRVPKTAYGVAQFINDSCFPDMEQHVVSVKDVTQLNNAYDCMQKYKRKSRAAAMVCVDQRGHAAPMWYFALRDIRQGEEIVNTYGEHYWTIELLRTSNSMPVHLTLSLMYEPEYYKLLLNGKLTDDTETDVILDRYCLRQAVDTAWEVGRFDEGDMNGNPLSRRAMLLMMVQLIFIKDP